MFTRIVCSQEKLFSYLNNLSSVLATENVVMIDYYNNTRREVYTDNSNMIAI